MESMPNARELQERILLSSTSDKCKDIAPICSEKRIVKKLCAFKMPEEILKSNANL